MKTTTELLTALFKRQTLILDCMETAKEQGDNMTAANHRARLDEIAKIIGWIEGRG